MNSSEGGGGGLTQRKKQETSFDVVDRVEKLDEPKQYVGYGEVLDIHINIPNTQKTKLITFCPEKLIWIEFFY